MDRLTVDYGKKFSPFRYAMKDGSDAEIGYFKNYDAFYSHMLMVQKLGEYEDLEEQGLLLRLPVPIGTTVYKFEPLAKGTKRYIKTIITRYEVFDDSIWFTFANGLGRNIEDFGKYVFLTKEEAEQKLKEMESD